MSGASGWRATRALSRGLGVGAAAGAAGMWTGRVDIAVAGGALIVAVALATGRGRPRLRASVRAVAPAAAAAGDVVVLEVTAVTPPGTELVAVRLPDVTTGPGGRQLLTRASGTTTMVQRRFPVAGWGSLRLARPDWCAASADGLFVSGPFEAREIRVAIVPAPTAGGGVTVPPRASGQLGSHRARAQGDGSEVLGVREYRPGDLLRRIDWRVSNRRLAALHPAVRQGSLYVRTMVAETDSDVLLLVDTRLDIAPTMAAWDLDLSRQSGRMVGSRMSGAGTLSSGPLSSGLMSSGLMSSGLLGLRHRGERQPLRPSAAAPGGSLDATIDAAVAVAADHIHAGDRVTLIDLGRPRASLPAGSGRRHLDRIRFRLGQVAVEKLGVWRPGSLVPAITPLVTRAPTQSIAVVISAFYDAEVVDLAVSLAHSGRPVIAVDTAPVHVAADPRVPRSAEALALVAAERAQRLVRLSDAGIGLRPWAGPQDRGRSATATGDRVGRRDQAVPTHSLARRR